jgi:hypothetical protein
MLTPAALEILGLLAKHEHTEEGEIVCDRLNCYLGYRRVHWKTINKLSDCSAITNSAHNNDAKRYVITEIGHAILRRPELAEEVYLAYLRKKNFTIRNDRVVLMEDR